MHDLIIKSDNIISQELANKSALDLKKRDLYASPLYVEVKELERKDSELMALRKDQDELIKTQMLNAGLKEFETLDWRRLLLKKTPWKCVITNELEIADKYKVSKTEVVLDKKALLHDLRQWHAIHWADIEYDYSLSIK